MNKRESPAGVQGRGVEMTAEPKAVLIQQLKWLNHLQTLQNKPVLVKGLPPNTQAPKDILPKDSMTFHGHKWNFYKDTWAQLKEPYFTRSILQCEIVFDPDTPIWKDMKEEYGKLIETLDRLKIPYLLTYSGGKGCHLHIFFDMHTNIPEELFDRAKKAEYDITEAFREYLFYYIVGQAKIDLKKLKIDLPKITFQVKSMGSQIRDFGTMRTNGFCKTLITKVPDHQPETPSPPVFPDKVELWKIPEMHKDVLIQKIEEGIIGQVEYNKEIPKNITGIDSIDTIPCIANILPGLDAGRYYGACAIALIGKELSYSWEKIEPLVSTYLNKCKGLSRDDIEIRITESENIYESSKRFSCKYIRDNLNCPSPGGCIVQKRKEANNVSMKSCYNDLLGDVAEREERKQAALDLSGIPTDNFIIKYIIYAMRMTDAYPEYHLGNAFFLLSIAANRKIQVRFAHDTIYPNIWMFLIGDSTIARKTASITIGHEKIGVPVFGFNPFLPQSTSPEALIEELSNNSKASLVRDEAGGFLRELDKNYMAGFKDVLCSLYDNKDYHRKIRTSQRKNSQTDFNIKNPYVNVLFATTPDIFKNCNYSAPFFSIKPINTRK